MNQRFGPLLFVPGEKGGRYPYCHSLYVEADYRVVIDPASDRQRLAEIRDSSGVDAIWLSHFHEDHMMHLDLFADRELWISAADAPAMASLKAFFDYYGLEGELQKYWEPILVDVFHFQPRRPTRLFEKAEVIDLGGVTVEVIPAPGHTPGHLAFFFREPGVLFLGDYDLTPFGPYYGDRCSDIEATIASINRLRAIPAKVWIAAHEQGVFETDPGELWDRYLGVIADREAKLLALLESPRTIAEIVDARILYGKIKEPKEFYDFGERGHMTKHLQRLMAAGRVARNGERYYRG